MAYVPQASTMAFPYLSKEVVLMGRIAHLGSGASPSSRDRKICQDVLEELGITHLSEKVFNQMSGGERQMFLVARAMVQQAQILVMDEPTANLDYSNQVRILQVIKQLSEEGYSILMTSHFPDHAFLSCNKVMLLKEGKIIKIGKPEEVVTSQNLTRLYETSVYVTDVDRLKDITAVKENAIYAVPTVAHTWGNRTVEQPLTIMWTMNKIYPEIMTTDMLKEEIEYFYSHFFKTDLSDEQITEIIG